MCLFINRMWGGLGAGGACANQQRAPERKVSGWPRVGPPGGEAAWEGRRRVNSVVNMWHVAVSPPLAARNIDPYGIP